jgi:Tfp pilus assembly protein PilF
MLTGAVGLLAAAPPAVASPARNDYVNAAFTAPLSAGLRAFYSRDFATARTSFDAALLVIPDNTLALSMLDATAAQQPGELDALVDYARQRPQKRARAHAGRLCLSVLIAGRP